MSSRDGLFALTGVGLMVLLAIGPAAALGASAGDATGNTAGNTDTAAGNAGLTVSGFVHGLLDQGSTNQPMGQLVSEFVHENNPGNPPDHAGPPEHAGDGGRPEHVGNDDGGPPEHAGAAGNTNAASEHDDEHETEHEDGHDDEHESGHDDGGGPPEHANGKDSDSNN